jgi:hypothetical protein
MYRVLNVAVITAVSTIAYGSEISLTTTGAGIVTIPAGYEWTNVTVQCWGGGGGAAYEGAGGGGGGAYSSKTYATLAAGAYNYYVGAGGAGSAQGDSFIQAVSGSNTIWNYGGAQDIIAGGGGAALIPGENGGAGGLVLAGTGYAGGAGGSGATGGIYGGGGGGSGGPAGPGGPGGNEDVSLSGPFPIDTGGTGGAGYGNGGNAGVDLNDGDNGGFPGGGGGAPDGSGASGEIIVTYTQQAVPEPSAIALMCAGTVGLLATTWRYKQASQSQPNK